MEVFRGKIKDGVLKFFKADMQRLEKFYRENEGADVELRDWKPTNYSKRKFFEGPVTQYFFYQHEPGAFENFKEAREALKLECNPVRVKGITPGFAITAGGSTAEKSDKWFANFLERIQHQVFLPNGYEFPDSEEYNAWINSAPGIGEVYPPVELLAKNYKRKLDEQHGR